MSKQYIVYRTFKLVVEANSIAEANVMVEEVDLSYWDFSEQIVEQIN